MLDANKESKVQTTNRLSQRSLGSDGLAAVQSDVCAEQVVEFPLARFLEPHIDISRNTSQGSEATKVRSRAYSMNHQL